MMMEILHDKIYVTNDYVVRLENIMMDGGGVTARYTVRHKTYGVLATLGNILSDVIVAALQLQQDADKVAEDPEAALQESQEEHAPAVSPYRFTGGGGGTKH